MTKTMDMTRDRALCVVGGACGRDAEARSCWSCQRLHVGSSPLRYEQDHPLVLVRSLGLRYIPRNVRVTLALPAGGFDVGSPIQM